jgi:hypothetical protein
VALSGRMNRLEKAGNPRLALVASLLFATACLAISAHAVQVGRFSNQEYEGTWKAVHDGRVFIVLRLHRDKDHLSGTVQLAGFQLDLEGTGELLTVTDDQLDTPIDLRDLKSDGKMLDFHFVDNDGDDDKWQMELTGPDKASLLWIELPKGLKAKPIPLVKQRESDPKAK